MTGTDWMRPDPSLVERAPIDLHTDRPHSARVYDYLLGGKDNFPADREVAEADMRANPASRVGPPPEPRVPAPSGPIPRRRCGHPPVS